MIRPIWNLSVESMRLEKQERLRFLHPEMEQILNSHTA